MRTESARTNPVMTLLALLLCLAVAGQSPHAPATEASQGGTPVASAPVWPTRVLITNDDGFDDPAMLALARAFAGKAETYVVAPTIDRSGTSNFMAVVGDRRFRVEKRDLGDERIVAYALDGYPADCITFALSGPLRDAPPDLVISGINGGSNLGDAWFVSGTIGAARTAAFYDLPAIAVSGVNKDDSTSVRAVADWVVAFAGSEPVRSLKAPRYMTVSLPLLPPTEIRGVKVVRRAPSTISAITRLEPGPDGGSQEVWSFELLVDEASTDPDTDVAAVAAGHIAIVPMLLEENDPELMSDLRDATDRIPAWPARQH